MILRLKVRQTKSKVDLRKLLAFFIVISLLFSSHISKNLSHITRIKVIKATGVIRHLIEYALVTLGLVTDVHFGHACWHRAVGNTLLATNQAPVEHLGSSLVVSGSNNIIG